MPEISLTLVWRQHQPYYLDELTGHNPMPWVRLHAAKDYWGMAMHLWEVPEARANIILSPSLMKQLLAYGGGGHEDEHLRISRLPADSLDTADRAYLLDNFFMASVEHMIRPRPRYLALYEQRGFGVDTADRAASRFSQRDILDLQVWNNLVWIHPLAVERDEGLADLLRKGEGFSENEKQWLLAKQMELVADVIPLHRRLAERGQVELIATPFYHPILPLLCDKRLALQAMPHVKLPERMEGYPADAARQVLQGVDYHEAVFGARPRGLWPSEGGVAHELISILAPSGVEWIATDEEILSCSLGGAMGRDGQGVLRGAELLYRPWAIDDRGKRLQVIFRDQAISDAIGFHYRRFAAGDAVDDFLARVERIPADPKPYGGHPPLVSVILDGDNCWEHYPDGGVAFLRSLYERLADHPRIGATRVSDYLDAHPAMDRIPHLFAGSWIRHDFGVWLGHDECNRAWDLVSATREVLRRHSLDKLKPPEVLERAWEELYIAEGSDWFCWFGDSHSSAQDQVFDRLFRKHLENVYQLLGEMIPAELLRPVGSEERHALIHTQPSSLLNVKVNGRATYFEWLNAGHFATSPPRGRLVMADTRRLESLWFGFDEARLFLRVDTRNGPAREALADIDSLRLTLVEPAGFELLVERPALPRPRAVLTHHGAPVSGANLAVATETIVEIAIPWRLLGLTAGDSVRFFVEIVKNELALERAPRAGALEIQAPSPEFELIMWQA